jgi:hypothetical protein
MTSWKREYIEKQKKVKTRCVLRTMLRFQSSRRTRPKALITVSGNVSGQRSGRLNRLRRFTVFGEGVQVLGVASQELDQVGPLDLLRHSLVQQLDVVGEVVVVGVVGAGDLFEVVRTVGVRKA